ncbi:MAG: MFS transporter [Phycisphaerales bacterium]
MPSAQCLVPNASCPPMPYSRNLWLVSWTSLLNDISSDMVYPLIGFFLTGSLGASAVVVGIIEGVAESLACFLKVGAGWWSDRVRHRKWFAVAGYAISVIGKALNAFAPAWGMVLAGRSLDKVGKGVRTAPRDALIAEEADPQHRGRAFGFHKAMDTTGAVLGVLIAYAALMWLGGSEQTVRQLMVVSLVPSILAIGVLMLVREKRVAPPPNTGAESAREAGQSMVARREASGEPLASSSAHEMGGPTKADTADPPRPPRALSLHPLKAWRALTPRLRAFYIIWFVFNLGASSDMFLFLWAHQLGATIPQVVLMYLAFNIVNALTSEPAGRLSDRVGRRAVLASGCAMYALVYAGFALCHGLEPDRAVAALFALFAIYGVQRALTDGVAKALVADLCPKDAKATALGLLDMLAGVGVLLASIVAGLLWEGAGAASMMWFGAGCAGLATLGLIVTQSTPRGATAPRP